MNGIIKKCATFDYYVYLRQKRKQTREKIIRNTSSLPWLKFQRSVEQFLLRHRSRLPYALLDDRYWGKVERGALIGDYALDYGSNVSEFVKVYDSVFLIKIILVSVVHKDNITEIDSDIWKCREVAEGERLA